MTDVDDVSIDVLLPVRSPAPWLVDTLNGLNQQTLKTWRLVAVCHGYSPDVIETIRHWVPGAIILVAAQECSFPEVLNLGLQSCTASFVARIDADDIPMPERFEEQVNYLSLNPKVALVATPVVLIDHTGTAIGRTKDLPTTRDLIRGLRWKCVIQHPSVMFRRLPVVELGGYDPLAVHVEDYDLWLRLAQASKLAVLNKPLTEYRVHPDQVTRTKVIGRAARNRVNRARIALANSKGESVTLARLRQSVWSLRQISRSLSGRRIQ